jgi:hypothetical protein
MAITITNECGWHVKSGYGASHASSGRAVGGAPADLQKRVSKASGCKRRKRLKTTADLYHESNSNPDSELKPLPPAPAAVELS